MDPFSKHLKGVENLVVDAGGFLKHVELQNVGQKIYTLHDVVAEIKDKNTKERLAVVPYEIIFREPPVEMIKMVTEFAKKTGDFNNLSTTDIKVIALTLLLEKEISGLDHIRTNPVSGKTLIHTPSSSDADSNVRQSSVPGFFLPKDEDDSISYSDRSRSTRVSESVWEAGDAPSIAASESIPELSSDLTNSGTTAIAEELENLQLTETCPDEWVTEEDECLAPSTFSNSNLSNLNEENDGGWITPSNVKQVYEKMGVKREQPTQETHKVACLTTDFSVQNVALQMGMHVIGPDGMLIKSLRTYVLRCFACFKVTHNTTKKFCPSCGNATLKRVCMTVDKDGQPKYHISTKRPLNTRGTKFSLPLPKGGKHAVNPILCEDQPQPHYCASKKSLQKLNVMDTDYVCRDSPFLFNDLTSRASQLGRHGNKLTETKYWMKKNPNAARKPKG